MSLSTASNLPLNALRDRDLATSLGNPFPNKFIIPSPSCTTGPSEQSSVVTSVDS